MTTMTTATVHPLLAMLLGGRACSEAGAVPEDLAALAEELAQGEPQVGAQVAAFAELLATASRPEGRADGTALEMLAASALPGAGELALALAGLTAEGEQPEGEADDPTPLGAEELAVLLALLPCLLSGQAPAQAAQASEGAGGAEGGTEAPAAALGQGIPGQVLPLTAGGADTASASSGEGAAQAVEAVTLPTPGAPLEGLEPIEADLPEADAGNAQGAPASDDGATLQVVRMPRDAEDALAGDGPQLAVEARPAAMSRPEREAPAPEPRGEGAKSAAQQEPAFEANPVAAGNADAAAPAPRATFSTGTLSLEAPPEVVAARLAGEVKQLTLLDRDEAILRLQPPDLGRVHVHLSLQSDGVAVQMTVESDAVRSMLQEHLDRLRSALGEQGLHAGTLSVQVSPQDANASGANAEGAGAQGALGDATQWAARSSFGRQGTESGHGGSDDGQPRAAAGAQRTGTGVDYWI